MEIVIGKSGNQKQTISDPTVSRKHCRVTDNGDGTYYLENLSQNGTKVNGQEVIKTKVGLNDLIQLGPRFSATLIELIGNPLQQQSSTSEIKRGVYSASPNKKSHPKEIKTYNISHLRQVWEDFNQTNVEIAEKQRKINLIRTGSTIFTMSAALVASLTTGPVGWILTGIGIFGNIYSFAGLKNVESTSKRQIRQDEFDDAWVCPNPECGKSLPAKNYKHLYRNFKCCPYCKSNFVEQ